MAARPEVSLQGGHLRVAMRSTLTKLRPRCLRKTSKRRGAAHDLAQQRSAPEELRLTEQRAAVRFDLDLEARHPSSRPRSGWTASPNSWARSGGSGAMPWAAASPDILPPMSAHTDLHHVHRAFPDEVELRRALTRPGRRGARERSGLRVFARLHVRPRSTAEALYRILLPGVLSLKGVS